MDEDAECSPRQCIEVEAELLRFLSHNSSKIIYVLRHKGKKIFNFDVDKHIDVLEKLKRKKFVEIDQDPEDARIAMEIIELMFANNKTQLI